MRIAKIRRLATPYTHILINALIQTIQGTGSAVAIFLFIATVMSGTLMYNFEKNADSGFDSIPRGMWWSIVTMTTVGYGDLFPQSVAGYFLGVATILIGMALTSLIIMVIGQYYIDLLSEFEDEVKHIQVLLWNVYGNQFKESVLGLSIEELYDSIRVELRLAAEKHAGNPLFQDVPIDEIGGGAEITEERNSIFNRKESDKF